MYGHRTRLVSAIFAAFVATGIGMGAPNAQTQSPLGGIAGAPGQLLQQNPSGGQLLINALETLVLTNPSTFNTILGSVGGANEQQKIAIATALSQAAKTMVLTNEPLAADWQQKILDIKDPAFNTAAVNAFGDVKLGAIGGAPGTGPLGGLEGAPGGGGGGGLQDIRSGSVATGPFTFGSGVGGLGFVAGNCANCSTSETTSGSVIISTPNNQVE
jgi:hypothetical protein